MKKIILGLALLAISIMPIASQAQTATVEELLAIIAQLRIQIEALRGGGENVVPTTLSCQNITENLRYGSRGAQVTVLQQYLIDNNYAISDGPTGFYGMVTMRAVIAWQRANGLTATGYFGPESRAKLKELCGGQDSINRPKITISDTNATYDAVYNGGRPAATTTVKFYFTLDNLSNSDIYINKEPNKLAGYHYDSMFAKLTNLVSNESEIRDGQGYFVIPANSDRSFRLEGYFGNDGGTPGIKNFRIDSIYFSNDLTNIAKYNIETGLELLQVKTYLNSNTADLNTLPKITSPKGGEILTIDSVDSGVFLVQSENFPEAQTKNLKYSLWQLGRVEAIELGTLVKFANAPNSPPNPVLGGSWFYWQIGYYRDGTTIKKAEAGQKYQIVIEDNQGNIARSNSFTLSNVVSNVGNIVTRLTDNSPTPRVVNLSPGVEKEGVVLAVFDFASEIKSSTINTLKFSLNNLNNPGNHRNWNDILKRVYLFDGSRNWTGVVSNADSSLVFSNLLFNLPEDVWQSLFIKADIADSSVFPSGAGMSVSLISNDRNIVGVDSNLSRVTVTPEKIITSPDLIFFNFGFIPISNTTLLLSTTFIDYGYTIGDSVSGVYNSSITAINGGNSDANIRISVDNQPAWLNTSYNTNILTIKPGQPMGIGASVNPIGLSAGTYRTEIKISGNFVDSPKVIPIVLKVFNSIPTDNHPNLIQNSDFSGGLTSWSTLGTGGSSAVSNGALTITNNGLTASTYHMRTQNVQVRGGIRYEYGGKIKAQLGAKVGSMQDNVCQIDVVGRGLDTDDINVRSSGDWQNYNGQFTAPIGTTNVSLRLVGASPLNGTCSFDDLYIRSITPGMGQVSSLNQLANILTALQNLLKN